MSDSYISEFYICMWFPKKTNDVKMLFKSIHWKLAYKIKCYTKKSNICSNKELYICGVKMIGTITREEWSLFIGSVLSLFTEENLKSSTYNDTKQKDFNNKEHDRYMANSKGHFT